MRILTLLGIAAAAAAAAMPALAAVNVPPNTVPEPGTWLLVGVAAAVAWRAAKRRR